MGKLNDKAIQAAKPAERQYKIADGDGLALIVKPNGTKLWWFRYRFGGKEKTLALGTYPVITLRDLPDEAIIEGQTGIAEHDQVTLISELTNCGFLDIEDVAGHLPLYSLSEDFAWEGRYKLFTTAMHDWDAKKNRPMQQTEVTKSAERALSANFYEFDAPEFPLGQLSADAGGFTIRDESTYQTHEAARDVQIAKAEQARVQRERTEKIDKVLAHVLVLLFNERRAPLSKGFVLSVSKETGVGERLVQLILSGKGKNMPKVIATQHNGISINSRLDWEDLADYPLTQEVCKSFLKM